MYTKIFQLIDQSSSIVITGHLGPDPDSIASVFFLYRLLTRKYPDKKIIPLVQGGLTDNFRFLEGSESTDNRDIEVVINAVKPDLLVILDVAHFNRVSKDQVRLKNEMDRNNTKLLIIDHHPGAEVAENVTEQIIENSSSTAEILYSIFSTQPEFELNLHDYEKVAIGMMADTNNFMYKPAYNIKKSLEIFGDLIARGVGIADLWGKVTVYTDSEIRTIGTMVRNFMSEEEYNYTFIEMGDILNEQLDRNSFKKVSNHVANQYLRATTKKLGFLVYPDFDVQGRFNISFRALEEYFNALPFAEALNGGGHPGSCGGFVDAASLQEAIEKIKNVINNNLKKARQPKQVG